MKHALRLPKFVQLLLLYSVLVVMIPTLNSCGGNSTNTSSDSGTAMPADTGAMMSAPAAGADTSKMPMDTTKMPVDTSKDGKGSKDRKP